MVEYLPAHWARWLIGAGIYWGKVLVDEVAAGRLR